jgi:hypothetical protein
MYDNTNLAIRCRALWADILCAIESRVWSVNDYVRDSHARLECQMLNADAVQIEHPSAGRTLVASLDLNEHGIQIKEYQDSEPTVSNKLPFAMLGDGNVYVTNARALLGDAMAVARELISVLLSSVPESATPEQLDQFRSWASALMTARAFRTQIRLPIEIQTETAIYPASTIDLSSVGAKVESKADLDRGNYVTVFRGTLGSFFRVVWTEKTPEFTRAGLVCLNPPLEWLDTVTQ